MIPRQAGRGRSFVGAGRYYLHDKRAETSERVAFTHTENVPTNDPEKALKWMAFTAMHADDLKRESGGRVTSHSCGKPVFTFSLAWHPEQEPNQHEMVGAGRTALEALGLQKHEALMVSHTDRPHPHMHVIVNVVDPETGKAHSLSYSKTKLSDWAENYERENGKIYCDQRVENNQKRQQGEYVKYREPEVDLKTEITELYRQSDSGAAFQAGLSEMGYTLARGKRIVLIDQEGTIHSLYRQIEGAKAAEIKSRLGDIELPDLEGARGQAESVGEAAKPEQKTEAPTTGPTERNPKSQPEVFDRDQQDRDWQESIIDAAIEHADNQSAPRQRPLPAPDGPIATARAGALDRRSRHQDPDKAKLQKLFPLPTHVPPTPAQKNLLMERQADERLALYSEHLRRRRENEALLDRTFRNKEAHLQEQVNDLEHTLSSTNGLQRWWMQLTNKLPNAPEKELADLREQLAETKEQIRTTQDDFEQRVSNREQSLRIRHEQEQRALEPRSPQQRDFDIEAALRDQHLGDEPEEDDGPSFEC